VTESVIRQGIVSADEALLVEAVILVTCLSISRAVVASSEVLV
jgi:hypothetical protein